MMAAGGPPVVEAATGEKVAKEELGGSAVHCYVSGVAQNECASDFDDLMGPRDTRPLIIKALRAARGRNRLQLGPRYKHGIMP